MPQTPLTGLFRFPCGSWLCRKDYPSGAIFLLLPVRADRFYDLASQRKA